MNSVKEVRVKSNVNPLQANRQRRNSELPPKKIENPHSKVIKTKKVKGQPADPETLMGVINLFRKQYGQNALEIEPQLAKYVNLAINHQKIKVQIPGSVEIQHAVLVDDFTGQPATSFIKSWIKEGNTLNALLSPANKGYVEFVGQEEDSIKVVFINVLTFN